MTLKIFFCTKFTSFCANFVNAPSACKLILKKESKRFKINTGSYLKKKPEAAKYVNFEIYFKYL